MKRSFVAALAVSCALILTTGARAQEGKKGGGEHSMTGCLKQGNGDTFMLTDVEGGRVSSVGIVSSDANLKPHVGHKIEITGTAVPPAQAREENKNVGEAPHYMKVTSMKMVSRTCP
jgi:hypothetical protein